MAHKHKLLVLGAYGKMRVNHKSTRPVIRDATGLSSACLSRFDSGYYKSPTEIEIRRLMAIFGLSGGDVADILGVSDSRTVRRWTAGASTISYSSWRLLLWELGVVTKE